MKWLVLVALVACSSPHGSTAGDASPGSDGPGADAPGADAGMDAPVLGATCPSHVTEVARLTSALSAYPYVQEELLVSDLDHDGKQDIAAIEGESDDQNMQLRLRVRAFLRQGTGFAPAVQSDLIFPFYGPETIVTGDFNGDHLQDILLTYTDSGSSSRVSYVYIALQQPDHTFVLGSGIDVSACKFSDDERLFALAVLDVDGDGYDDVLATVSYDGLGAAPAGLSLLRGGPDGLGFATCARSATTTSSGYPADMVTAERFRVGDFDGDGKPDVAGLYSDKIVLFHATGPAQFERATADASYDEFSHVAVDHLAGRTDRGLIELDAGSTSSSASRYTITTAGVAASQPIAMLAEDGGGFDVLRGFAVGDFNGDGYTDMIEVGNHDYSDNYPDPVSFGLACDRSAHWDLATGTFPNGIYDLRAIDFAGTGATDALVHEGSDYDLVIYSFN